MQGGSLAAARLLLERRADPTATNNYSDTALHVAASSGALAVVKLLVGNGAAPLAQNRFGATALDVALREDASQMARPEEHEQLAQHISLLIQLAAWHGCSSVLHISSIAVADHVTTQHLVTEDDPVPPVEALSSPYDRFKLRCEQIVDTTCAANRSRIKTWTHLRISGIFSNDPACIQCSAVRQQWLVSVRSRWPAFGTPRPYADVA